MKISDLVNYPFIFLYLIIPGFIIYGILRLKLPISKIDTSKLSLEILAFGTINYLIFFFVSFILSDDKEAVNTNLWYLAIFTFNTPILLGLLVQRLLKWDWFKAYIFDITPTSWDYIFGKGEDYWVIVHLKDNRRIGGYFGPESSASKYPAKDLYLEEVWLIDEDDAFERAVPDTKGIYIHSDNIVSIEFLQTQ